MRRVEGHLVAERLRLLSQDYRVAGLATGGMIDAATAREWGLVSKVVPAAELMNEARALAGRICRQPPDALRLTKRLMRDSEPASFETICLPRRRYRRMVLASRRFQMASDILPRFDSAMRAKVIGALLVAALASTAPAQAYTEKTLYSFCSVRRCHDGSSSEGVVLDPAGNLFGVTTFGGKHDAGVVYEFVPSTGQYSVLYNFCSKAGCADGSEPGRVNLVIDTNGNLYGTTSKGGSANNAGVVFELIRTDTGYRQKTLYAFCPRKNCVRDGSAPRAGLTYAGAASNHLYDGISSLYGTTWSGETGGAVFSLTPKAGTRKWTEQVLYSFCSQANCADGVGPDVPLYIDAQGNIYGTTPIDPGLSYGIVFELSPTGMGYTETVLYSFCAQANCGDGVDPESGVVMDTAGNLFGTTEGGGDSLGQGVVFQLSPKGSEWQYSDLENFGGTDGQYPESALIIDANGNLFGTTYAGGQKQHGNVFEFNGSIQSLYSFCPQHGCSDGEKPLAGVVKDASGNLFGVTSAGGKHQGGTIFELSP